jgi:hypothetical protein
MNIDTIQCKRITSGWDNKKGYKPADGELVYICVSGIFNGNPFIVIGMSNMTVKELYDAGCYFESHKIVGSLLNSLKDTLTDDISTAKDECKTYTDTTVSDEIEEALNNADTAGTPKEISSTSSAGSATKKFSRVDHQHKVTEDTLKSVLNCNSYANEWHCRRIKMEYNKTPPNNNVGEQGDIWIVY